MYCVSILVFLYITKKMEEISWGYLPGEANSLIFLKKCYIIVQAQPFLSTTSIRLFAVSVLSPLSFKEVCMEAAATRRET